MIIRDFFSMLSRTLKRLSNPILSLFALILILASVSYSNCVKADEVLLDKGWQYRWGDSPFSEQGKPQWAQDDNLAQWHAIAFPVNPPDRQTQQNVWFKVTLPDVTLRDPVLYVSSIDFLVEAYLDGARIYRHGKFDEQGQGSFAGWPWHMLTLPADFAGKTLYFRVFSNYKEIGFWGEVKLNERIEILEQVVDESIQGLVVAGVTLFIGLMAAVFALLQGQRRQFLSVCLFSFAAAGLVLGDIPAMKLIWDWPLLWNYIGAYAYFLLPIPMFMLLADWLSEANVRVRHFQWLWQFHFVFLLLAATCSLLGVVSLTQLYPLFDGIFTVTLLLLLGSVVFIFGRVSLEQKILILAYFGFCAVMMLDMAVANSWVSWSTVSVSSGALLFSVAIIGLSINHYLFTQRCLGELNLLLESKVDERTEQLAILAEKERFHSNSLQFERAKLEIIGEINLALEKCHTLDEGVDKVASLIAKLCQPFAGIYRIVRADSWQVAKSWGNQAIIAEPNIGAIINTEYNQQQGQFPFNIVNQQGRMRCVALLQVKVDHTASSCLAENLMLLIQQGIGKMSLVLANIALREELQRFSYEDVLTNLKNRRFFTQVLEHEIATAKRNKQTLSLLICDIDFFKKFNDKYGHTAGDEALKTFANLLSRSFREADIACRLGGEEFVVIMPNASSEECFRRAQQLTSAVANTQIVFEGKALDAVTISSGIANWPESTAEPEHLLQQADLALYDAKHRGRNCIKLAKLRG